jgi:primosomal replication protein N
VIQREVKIAGHNARAQGHNIPVCTNVTVNGILESIRHSVPEVLDHQERR